MTSVNTQMLNNIQTVSKQSATESKVDTDTEGASFEKILTEAMPASDETVTNVDRQIKTETQTDVKELMTKLLQTISNGCSEQDIEKLTEGLSQEQIDMLTELIGKIAQIISEEINGADGTGENTLADAVISVIGEKNETDEKDVKLSEEVISDAVATMVDFTEISNVNFENNSDTAYKTVENIASEIVENLSSKLTEKSTGMVIENSGDKLINAENMLSDIADKLSKSNPQMSEFATKLQSISQEISKTVNNSSEQMSDMKISNIKVSTTPQVQQITKENSLVSNESFDKTLIKVSKNQGELSELTALTGNVNTEVIEMQGEQIKSVQAQAPVENQVLNFIKTEVLPSVKTSGTTKMTMTLNPEQLGEISVKLAKTGTALTVAISCNNSVTQEMIENRLPQLISSLSAGENKTVDVTVVTPNQNASEFMNNFTMSQQNGNQQFESQHQQTHYAGNKEVIDNTVEVEEIYKEGRLWQTV